MDAKDPALVVTMAVDGMSCGRCVEAVRKALERVPGVRVIRVQVGRADLERADQATLTAAIAAVDDAGFLAKLLVSQTESIAPLGLNGCGNGGCACVPQT